MIPQEVINQIIEKVNIAEVIAEYIPVLPDGTGFKSVCPFHNDTNPSMKISPSKRGVECLCQYWLESMHQGCLPLC